MPINKIVTPLDSAALDSREQYDFYHKMVDFVLKELIASVSMNHLCTEREAVFFKQYCDVLLYSVDAMRIKYMYDEDDNMKVDLTESGFPNYLEFRYLYNDLSLKQDYQGKLKNVDQLKEDFLDCLLRDKKPVPKNKLYQAASIVYYTKVEQRYIFNRFVQGKIIDLPENSVTESMVSWSFYDISLNRPFVCFMYFDVDGHPRKEQKPEIYEVLKNTADRMMNLDSMAYAIDKKLPKIHPKIIKRMDLGPLHNVFAKDENEVTHSILEGIFDKTVGLGSYAMSLQVDQVKSIDDFEDGRFLSKQLMQRWGEIENSKYLFAPHRVIQMLYNKTPELMDSLEKPPYRLSEIPIDSY